MTDVHGRARQQTLPIWIFTQPRAARTSCRSSTSSALVVILISIIPVWAAQKLAGPIEGDEAKTVGVAEP